MNSIMRKSNTEKNIFNEEDKYMNKMVKVLNKGYNKVAGIFRNIKNEEIGASELVVLVALIVIVLAVIVIFKSQLTNIVNTAGSKVIKWINAN